MSRRLVFNVIALVAGIFFLLATFWVWRGQWRIDQFDKADTRVVIEEKNIPAPVFINVTSTVATTSTKSVSTTTTIKIVEKIATSTTPRVAVSPLTGTLVLGDDDVNLKVPFTSQAPERNWDQPWQDACEEAALLMLDAYYKGYGLSPISAKDELQKMIDWETAQGWDGSVDIEHIKKIAADYFHIKRKILIIENPTVEQIKQYISAGAPVLVVADGKVLPNKFYSNGGPEYHALVIRGFTKDKFITNDPGVNRGTNFVFPIESVMESIHDWNGGDVKSGKRVILVVE